ncbi:hypothetical protein EDD15DRAFT_306975 [Pisolithus albus]|nr:hypothetical protein EDD15DRAFT_306975 [Pisolithus albus]
MVVVWQVQHACGFRSLLCGLKTFFNVTPSYFDQNLGRRELALHLQHLEIRRRITGRYHLVCAAARTVRSFTLTRTKTRQVTARGHRCNYYRQLFRAHLSVSYPPLEVGLVRFGHHRRTGRLRSNRSPQGGIQQSIVQLVFRSRPQRSAVYAQLFGFNLDGFI